MKWKELSGQERLEVVEMARSSKAPIKEICATFGVSRQTLYRAMKKTDEASVAALEPKQRGRKAPSEEAQRVSELEIEKVEMQKELEGWKTRYEVAQAFLELQRKYDRGELEKSPPSKPKKTAQREIDERRRRSRQRKKAGK
jgi:transposase-like protein